MQVFARSESGKSEEKLSRQLGFLRFAWWLPAGITTFVIIVLNLGPVEADSLLGVCFLSPDNVPVRFCFVSIPIILAVLLSGWFFSQFFCSLWEKYKSNKDKEKCAKLRSTLLKTSLYVIVVYVCCVYFVYFEISSMTNRKRYA